MRDRISSLPFFWRAFAANALAMVMAFAALVLGPVTVSIPIAATELAILASGLVLMLILNLMLLRPVFRPLDRLADTMRRHDPLSPGERVPIDGEPDVAALAQAFNEMLDRLESERRESARFALRVLEDERNRIARELHDEVGQTLTGVMLQVEGLAARIPQELQELLDELRETARSGTEEVRRIARQLRPEALEDLGLQSALSSLATAFGEQAGIEVLRRLEPSVELFGGARACRLPSSAGGAHERRPPRRGRARRAASRPPRVRGGADGSRRRSRHPSGRAALLARNPRNARARHVDRCQP
jgi:two-component system, NarL family, sensor histidine kinase UhpB